MDGVFDGCIGEERANWVSLDGAVRDNTKSIRESVVLIEYFEVHEVRDEHENHRSCHQPTAVMQVTELLMLGDDSPNRLPVDCLGSSYHRKYSEQGHKDTEIYRDLWVHDQRGVKHQISISQHVGINTQSFSQVRSRGTLLLVVIVTRRAVSVFKRVS